MIQRRVFVLLLTVLFAMPALIGTAQTPVPSGATLEDELPGIQAAVWRDYGPAGTFVGNATIGPATPIPEDELDDARLSWISVVVYEFDTAENAAAGFDLLSAQAVGSFATAFPDGTQEIIIEDLPDVGTQATLAGTDFAGGISRIWVEYVTVQFDQYVLLVSSSANAIIRTPGSDPADPELQTVPLATTIAADGELSPDEPTFVGDGTSTGGLWGFMPASDDPLLMGLVPISDIVIYPYPVPTG